MLAWSSKIMNAKIILYVVIKYTIQYAIFATLWFVWRWKVIVMNSGMNFYI